MKTRLNLLVKPLIVGCAAWLFAFMPSSAAAAPTPPRRAAYTAKVLSVLEAETGDEHLAEKARLKLATFSDAQIRLVGTLADRIANEQNTAGANIALLLLTALLVLS